MTNKFLVRVSLALLAILLACDSSSSDFGAGAGTGAGGDNKTKALIQEFENKFKMDKKDIGDAGKLLSQNPNDTKFYLFPQPDTPDNMTLIDYSDPACIANSGYNTSSKLILLIHDFEESITSSFPQKIIKAFLNNSDIYPGNNIVGINWEALALTPKKSDRAAAMQYMSKQGAIVATPVAAFISFLVNNTALTKLADVHIIGFGIGAQIGGMAAKSLKKTSQDSKDRIGRLTGLDAASSFFTITGPKEMSMIDIKSSVAFVDFVHTDEGRLGMTENFGQVDFLANGGGPYQPGCNDTEGEGGSFLKKDAGTSTTGISALDFESGAGGNMAGICSHHKAIDYFTMSINSKGFKGCKCLGPLDEICMKSCKNPAIFGYHVENSSGGPYMVAIQTDDVTDDGYTKFKKSLEKLFSKKGKDEGSKQK